MVLIPKRFLFSLSVNLVIAIFFLSTLQQTHAQNLGTLNKESATKEVKTENVKLEKEKSIATEKSEKTLQSTKSEQKEQSETRIESKRTIEKGKKEVESAKKSDLEEKLTEIKKNREEIALRKKHGKLTEKEYQDAVNKLDKIEKELKSKGKSKFESKGGR